MLMKATKMQHLSGDCFVCGVSNDAGTHAEFFELEDQSVIATVNFKPFHQSYPGTVHGGVTVSLLDETIGRALYPIESNNTGCTVEIVTRYWKPVPYNTPLLVVGRLTDLYERKFSGEGAVLLPDGTILTTATAKYVKMSNEAFEMFQVEDATLYLPEEIPDMEFDLPDDLWDQIRAKHEYVKVPCYK